MWGLTYHHTSMLQRVLYGGGDGGGVYVKVMINKILVSIAGFNMVKHICMCQCMSIYLSSFCLWIFKNMCMCMHACEVSQ